MLQYTNEHLNCSAYATPETALFFIRKICTGKTTQRKYADYTLLAFLFDGKIEVNYGINKKSRINAGNIFLLTKNDDIRITAIEKDAHILFCKFTKELKMCSIYSLNQLQQYMPQDIEHEMFYLPFDKRIKAFVNLIIISLHDGLNCMHYHQLKRDELFMYLRAGYTKEKLARFFYPVIGKNIDFKDFILTHYKNIYDVKEFAQKANMSLSTFNRHFKESFNDTAQKWLLDKKSERILNDILKSNLTFTELSEKYHFSSPAYFATFCKRHYGKTAAELRREGM